VPREVARDGSGQWTLDEHTRKLTVPATGGAGKLIDVVRDLGEAGVEIDDIALRRPTLDDVFLALTGRATADDDTSRGAAA
jgi:ABC-2 type transport system ATP-binding protein